MPRSLYCTAGKGESSLPPRHPPPPSAATALRKYLSFPGGVATGSNRPTAVIRSSCQKAHVSERRMRGFGAYHWKRLNRVPDRPQISAKSAAYDDRPALLVGHCVGRAERVGDLEASAKPAPTSGIAVDVNDDAAVAGAGTPEIVLVLSRDDGRKPVRAPIDVDRGGLAIVRGENRNAALFVIGQGAIDPSHATFKIAPDEAAAVGPLEPTARPPVRNPARRPRARPADSPAAAPCR